MGRISDGIILTGAGSRPRTPGNQSRRFPRRRSRLTEGVPRGCLPLVAGRRPRRGGTESSRVGRGLIVPSKLLGPPPLRGLLGGPGAPHEDSIFGNALSGKVLVPGHSQFFFPALVLSVVSLFPFFGRVRLGRRRERSADLFPGWFLASVYLMRHLFLC